MHIRERWRRLWRSLPVKMFIAVLIMDLCHAGNFWNVTKQMDSLIQLKPKTRMIIPFGDKNNRDRLESTDHDIRAMNAEPFYLKWPDPVRIPVDIDLAYTRDERRVIRASMGQISVDMKGCIRFVPYDPNNRTDFINVTPLEDAGSSRMGCWSFPGRVWNQNGRGQFIGVARGANGCSTNQREVMKQFVHVLGFRNVQNRPDRNQYIRINPENMLPDWRDINPYRMYTEAQTYYRGLPFDFNSITFHPPTKFARPGARAYDILDPNNRVSNLPQLSKWDCVGIATMYGCNPNFCEDQRMTTTEIVTSATAIPFPTVPQPPEEVTFERESPPTIPNLPEAPPVRVYTVSSAVAEVSKFPTEIPVPSSTVDPNGGTTPTSPAPDRDVANRICSPDFRVDTAVYGDSGKVYLFSGQYFWTMDYRGTILDAGIPVTSRFGGRVQPPVYAGWYNGSHTILVDKSRREMTTKNERFIDISPSLFPNIARLTEAFPYNTTTGLIIYYITDNGTQIQIGPTGASRSFSEFLLVGLGPKIDAAFTFPLLGTEIIGLFAGNDFAYVTPCTATIAQDLTPCFTSVGGRPFKFNNLVTYSEGNCTRRITLRFPRFEQI